MKYIGAHFGISKGFDELVNEADSFGANAFALFTKPAMQWKGKVITESASDKFMDRRRAKFFPADSILAHASYMINMGNPDEAKRVNAKNAYIDELKRCKQLGIRMLNIHPGSHLNGDVNESIRNVGKCVLEASQEVPEVITVFETMAGQGSNIGKTLEQIRDLIAASNCEDHVGVCIDTCHSFAAGYDIRTEEAYDNFMNMFDKVIGLKMLRGMHLNDSKYDINSNKDRHEHLGKGFIGIDAFKFIIKDKRTDSIPLILETPDENKWREEIQLLKSFRE